MGSLVAVFTGLLSLRRCQENWLSYRKTAELLKKERNLFEMGAGPYASDTVDVATRKLVERVEATISAEHQTWVQDHVSSEAPAPLEQ